MGKKIKKNKWKNIDFEKRDLKYKTRRDYLLSEIPDAVLYTWFGDNEDELKKYGDYLLLQDSLFHESDNDILIDNDDYFTEKYRKLISHKCKNPNDILKTIEKIKKVHKKKKKFIKKYKTGNKKDLNIVKYLDNKKYGKKFLNKDNYRKKLKSLAKCEKRDYDMMKKLGYIQGKNVDDEINKILNANKLMETALSDAYTQKHFV